MAYELNIHFTAGDKTYNVQRNGFRLENAVGAQGKHRTQSCAVLVRSREAGLLLVQEQARIVKAELTDGTDTIYQGVIRPYRSLSAYGKNEDPVSLEILDYTELLHIKVASSDGKVWHSTNLRSVIEDICDACDVSVTIDAPSALASTTVTYIKANSGEFYDEILSEILYEYGYDFIFKPNKIKIIKNHMEQGDLAPRITDLRNTLNITRSDSKDDGIEVRYNTYIARNGAGLVSHTSKEFTDTLVPGVVYGSSNHTGYYYNNTFGNASKTTEKWLKWNPTDFNMKDVVELTNVKAEFYLYGHVWYSDSNKATIDGYDLEGCAANLYYNTKFSTGVFSGGWSFGLVVKGDIIRKVEHTDSELVSGEEPKVIDARFLDNKTAAKELARTEARRLADCALTYSFDSLTAYEAGSFYSLVDTVTGIDTKIRILSCSLDADGIYSITAEGAGDVNASVDPVSLSLMDASSDANNWTSIATTVGTEPTNFNDVYAHIEGPVLDYIQEYGLTFKWYVNDVLVPSLTGTSATIPATSLQGGANTLKVEVFRNEDLIDEATAIVVLASEGEDGATFTPSVDESGNLSWTNNKELPNPPTVNIKGPAGNAAKYWGVLYEAPEGAVTGDYYVFGLCGNEGEEGEAELEGTVYVLSSGGSWEVMDVTSAENSSKVLTAYTDIIEKRDNTDFFSAPPTLSGTIEHMETLLANDIIAERIKANEGFFNSIHVTGNSQLDGQIDNPALTTFAEQESKTINGSIGWVVDPTNTYMYASIEDFVRVFGNKSFYNAKFASGTVSINSFSFTLSNDLYYIVTWECEPERNFYNLRFVRRSYNNYDLSWSSVNTNFFNGESHDYIKVVTEGTGLGSARFTGAVGMVSDVVGAGMLTMSFVPKDANKYVLGSIDNPYKEAYITEIMNDLLRANIINFGGNKLLGIEHSEGEVWDGALGYWGNFHAQKIFAETDFYIGGKSLVDLVYPKDSIFISLVDVSPGTYFDGTTWTKLSAGYALWTASSGAGNTIPASLPKITGSLNAGYAIGAQTSTGTATGAFRWGSGTNYSWRYNSQGGGYLTSFNFDTANIIGSVYTNTTNSVQPPAIKVYAWRRIK